MENKIVIIVRGTSGNGKSSFADYIKSLYKDVLICCADDYFTDKDGNYNWSLDKLPNAHMYCQNKFKQALLDEISLIIVANTSTREKDVNYYRNLAIEANYKVFVILLENWHNGTDIHNVPEETKERMKSQLKESIKF